MSVTLPLYPQQPAPGWCADFVGIPYDMGGRGPDLFDCWGLCWLVLEKHFGVAAPRYEGVEWARHDRTSRTTCGKTINDFAAAYYIPVEAGEERGGEIILLRMAGQPLHCGIVAAPGWMLHSAEGSESALERYDNALWRNRVEGLHRLKALA
jgi:cell wall-associated NlpC family hydrolase